MPDPTESDLPSPESPEPTLRPESEPLPALGSGTADVRGAVSSVTPEAIDPRDMAAVARNRLLYGTGDWKTRLGVLRDLHGALILAEHGERPPLTPAEAELYAYCAIGLGNTDAAAGIVPHLLGSIRRGRLEASVAHHLLGKVRSMQAATADGAEKLALTRTSVGHWSAVEEIRGARRPVLLSGAQSELPDTLINANIALPPGADPVAKGTLPPDRYIAAGNVAVAGLLLAGGDRDGALAHAELARRHRGLWVERRGVQESPFGLLNIDVADLVAQGIQVAARHPTEDPLAVRKAGEAYVARVRGAKGVVPVKQTEWEACAHAAMAIAAPATERGAILDAMLDAIELTLRVRPAAAGIFRFDGGFTLAFALLGKGQKARLDAMFAAADAAPKK